MKLEIQDVQSRLNLLIFAGLALIWISVITGQLVLVPVSLGMILFWISYKSKQKIKHSLLYVYNKSSIVKNSASKNIHSINKFINTPKKKKPEIKKPSMMVNNLVSAFKPILETQVMKKIEVIEQIRTKKSVRESGYMQNPRIHSKKLNLMLTIVILITAPIGIVAGFFVDNILFTILIIPCMLPLANFYSFKAKKSERNSLIEYELPPFAVYTAIVHSMNTGMYEAMLDLIKTDVGLFKIIKNECLLIRRDVEFFGSDFKTTAIKIIEHHPNKNFKEFIVGYLYALDKGGNPKKELEDKAEQFFEGLQEKFGMYVNTAQGYIEGIFIMFLILPIMIITISFIATEGFITQMTYLALLIIPIISLIFYFSIDAMQFKINDIIKNSPICMITMPITIITGIVLGLQPWLIIGITISIAALVNHLETRNQFKVVSETERGISTVLRAVAQDLLTGSDLVETFRNKSDEPGLNKNTRIMVKNIFKTLNHGKTITDYLVENEVKSWVVRFGLFLVGKMQETGTGKAQIVYNIALFTEKFVTAKKNMEATMKNSVALAYMGPIILILIKLTIFKVVGDIGDSSFENELDAINLNIDINALNVSDDLSFALDMLIMISAVAMGILITKTVYATLKSSAHLFGIVITTTILLYVSPHVIELSDMLLG